MIHATLNSPNSYLLLCPGCGDCWAKLAGTDQRFWWHRYVPCELCPEASFPYGGRLPGSLLEAEDLIEALPPDLLQREFLLIMSLLCKPELVPSPKLGQTLESDSLLPGQPMQSSYLCSDSLLVEESPSPSPLYLQEYRWFEVT